jgi:uncharacterized protein (DUF58 family)
MPIRRRAWLTREGWYYLAILAFIIGGAVLRSVNLLVVLAGTMIAPLLFNWRLAMASLTGLVIQRRLPTQILAGQPLTVEIHVRNNRWWMSTWLLRIEDWIEGQGSLGRTLDSGSTAKAKAMRAEAMIAHLPASGEATASYRVTLHRRGRYRVGPLRVGTRFPLGLVLSQMTLPDHDKLIVSPRLGRLLPAWTGLLEAEQLGDERRHPQRGISEGDYYGLRPWQSGDSLRWVHWRTTAKLARPIVRQYERRRSQDVAIVLDPWLPASATERDEGLAELAISFAATALCDVANRGHSRLTMAIAAAKPRCHTGPGSTVFCEDVLADLAELALSDGRSVSAAMQQALEASPRGTRLIVISPRPADDPSLSEIDTDLPLDPDELVWIDSSSEALDTLFTLT